MKKLGFFLAILLIVSNAYAGGELIKEMNSHKALAKISRGLTNIAAAPGEILTQMPAAMEQSPDYLTGFFMAAGRGIGYGLLRLGSGIYDVATFPFPGKTNYKPIMQPETIADKVLDYASN